MRARTLSSFPWARSISRRTSRTRSDSLASRIDSRLRNSRVCIFFSPRCDMDALTTSDRLLHRASYGAPPYRSFFRRGMQGRCPTSRVLPVVVRIVVRGGSSIGTLSATTNNFRRPWSCLSSIHIGAGMIGRIARQKPGARIKSTVWRPSRRSHGPIFRAQ